ncbi:MAG: YlbF family regulator [Defluviitaleaceae bacterium]|nr:YlbF family regulator [Defluviitaleaceae bacterium]
MSIYLEKAKELGKLILESDAAKNMGDAAAIYDADKEAVEQFEAYKVCFQAFQKKLEANELSEETYKDESAKLNEMADKLKEYPAIAGIISAENEFNAFVSDIMDVLRVTIMGQTGNGCGGGSGCGGCGSGCHSNQ